MGVFTCVFAWVYPLCVCMGVCLQVWVVCVYAWMCAYLCLHVCAYTHVHSLLIWCRLQGACHSLETHGSLLSITLRLVQKASEIIQSAWKPPHLGMRLSNVSACRCQCRDPGGQIKALSLKNACQCIPALEHFRSHKKTCHDSKSITSWRWIRFWNIPD